uniref:WW domain-containing protein n=1 Tax=Amorphochlora amoebiformis TaxID=1561963 RepID=A0A7S0DDB5_9EUKA
MNADGSVQDVRSGIPQCHYEGFLDGVSGSAAFLSTCTGGIHGLIGVEGQMIEMVYIKEESRHVVFDRKHFSPKKPFHCTVGEGNQTMDPHHHHNHHSHHHHNHHHHAHHGNGHRQHHTHHGQRHQDQQASSHPHKSEARLQTTSTCTAGQELYVGLAIINDHSRCQIRGKDVTAHTNTIFQYMYYYYYGGSFDGITFPGIYKPGSFDCKVVLRLKGQISYHSGNPSTFEYKTGSACTACGNQCSAGEISARCLLDSLSAFKQSNEASFDSMFTDVDNVQIFSETDFSASTIGLAWVSSMCSSYYSTSVNQVTSSSAIYNAQVATHEMGHNFGMSHDSAPGNIMNPSASNSVITSFSSESQQYIKSFVDTRYGISLTECLGTDPGSGAGTPVCGNGIVEGSESCDPGLQKSDPCCNDCALVAGCECSTLDACCDDAGKLRPATFKCRGSQDSTCDTDEYCTGSFGNCPTDKFKASGTSCSTTTPLGVTEDGLCYKGACVAKSSNCVDSRFSNYKIGASTTSSAAQICQQVGCRYYTSTQSYSVLRLGPAQAGTPCGSTTATKKQCGSAQQCMDSSSLKFYHWDFGSTGCGPIKCADETGAAVTDSFCGTERPPTPSICNAPSPTLPPSPGATPFPSPFPSPYPSPYPTEFPTEFPSAFPTPDPVPPVPNPTKFPTTVATPTPEPTPFPTDLPTGVPSPAPTRAPVPNPTAMPTAFPTNPPANAPTRSNKWIVRLTLSERILADITDALKARIKTRIAQFLGISENDFILVFVAGSVIVEAVFTHAVGTKSSGQIATDLSNADKSTLSQRLGESVAEISAPEEVDPDNTSESSGGSKSGMSTMMLAAIIGGTLLFVVIVAGIALWRRRKRKYGNVTKTSVMKTMPTGMKVGRNDYLQDSAEVDIKIPKVSNCVLPSGWSRHYDATGTPYYFNENTGESRWEKPALS